MRWNARHFLFFLSVFMIFFVLSMVEWEKKYFVNRSITDEIEEQLTYQTAIRTELPTKKPSVYEMYDLSDKGECDNSCQAEIQRNRLQRISEECDALGMTDQTFNPIHNMTRQYLRKYRHILVADTHKVMYCYIPKAGCTNWKRVFLVLTGKARNTDRLGQYETHVLAGKHVRTLDTYSVNDAQERLQNYSLFTFVRDPFSRLLSAYRDKLEKHTKLNGVFRREWGKLMKKIIDKSKYRFKGLELNVTFNEFVEYLSDPSHHLLGAPEEHWREMYRLCHPCSLQYKFVGKVETLERDTKYVLENVIHVSSEKVIYRNSTNPTNSSGRSLLREYFSHVPLKSIKALFERFAPDFEIFGYPKPDDVLGTCPSEGKEDR